MHDTYTAQSTFQRRARDRMTHRTSFGSGAFFFCGFLWAQVVDSAHMSSSSDAIREAAAVPPDECTGRFERTHHTATTPRQCTHTVAENGVRGRLKRKTVPHDTTPHQVTPRQNRPRQKQARPHQARLCLVLFFNCLAELLLFLVMRQVSWNRLLLGTVAWFLRRPHLRPWWEFHIPVESAASESQKPQVTTARGSENHKHKIRTTKNRDRTTLEGTTVDFSAFWWMKDLPHLEVSSQ